MKTQEKELETLKASISQKSLDGAVLSEEGTAQTQIEHDEALSKEAEIELLRKERKRLEDELSVCVE